MIYEAVKPGEYPDPAPFRSVRVTAEATDPGDGFVFPVAVSAEEVVRRLNENGIDARLGQDGAVELDEQALEQLGFAAPMKENP